MGEQTKGRIVIAVVSASVGLMVCLLFWFAQREKGKRNQVTCASNLRQIGQAMQMYVADNDGLLPTEPMWSDRTIPSLPRSGCPAAEPVPVLSPPLRGAGYGLLGYAFNKMLAGKSQTIKGRLTAMPLAYTVLSHPQTTIAVFDYTSGIPTTLVLDIYGNKNGGWPNQLAQGWKRHNGGGNYLFCDGHVAWFVESEILVTEPDICEGDKTRPNFCQD